jgi:hypothetical protein
VKGDGTLWTAWGRMWDERGPLLVAGERVGPVEGKKRGGPSAERKAPSARLVYGPTEVGPFRSVARVGSFMVGLEAGPSLRSG